MRLPRLEVHVTALIAPGRRRDQCEVHAAGRQLLAFCPVGSDDVGLGDKHDARRPLTPSALVAAVAAAVRGGQDAAVPALPLTDTVKRVDAEGFVRGSPDRAGLRVVQSPWMGRPGATVAHLVPGDPLAFAVRTEWDLELAEQLL